MLQPIFKPGLCLYLTIAAGLNIPLQGCVVTVWDGAGAVQEGNMTDPFAETDRIAALQQQQARQKTTAVIPAAHRTQARPVPLLPGPAVPAAAAPAPGLFGAAPAASTALALPTALQGGAPSPGGLFGGGTPAFGAPAFSTAPAAATTTTTRTRRTRR